MTPIDVAKANKARHEAAQRAGASLAETRKAKGLSLRDLEPLTGLSFGYLSGIEQGNRHPSLDAAKAILDAIDAPNDVRHACARVWGRSAMDAAQQWKALATFTGPECVRCNRPHDGPAMGLCDDCIRKAISGRDSA